MDVRRAAAAAAAAAKANICNLCDDLMMQILSRLPPKPLAICKCVCKSWRHLVSNLTHSPTRPRQKMTGLFIRSVYIPTRQENMRYCHRGDGEINVDESLSFLPSHPNTRIVDSREGFLLCSSSNLANYYVCNPLTRQWVPLPLPPQRSCSFPVNAALVLDESSDFGCLRYRVVLFQIVSSENPRMRVDVLDFSSLVYIDLYSSHTGKWAESWAFFKGNVFNVPRKPPVLLDGDVLWWAIPTPSYVVVMYNVKENCYKLFDFGNPNPKCCRSQCFGEYEGCPNYAYHDRSRMEVWMWKDNTSGWVLKHNMNLTDIGFPDLSAGSGPVRKGSLELLAFHPNLHAIFIRKKGDIFCYNFDTKALETTMSLLPSARAGDDNVFRVFPFSESICPLRDAQYK